MDATPIKILEHRDAQQRIVIVRREDGLYTYRHQWAAPDSVSSWGAMGPDCGVYDSSDTAEAEAMQRTDWLKENFH